MIQNPKSLKPDETDDLNDLANEISKAISLTRERRRAKCRLMEQSGPDTGVGSNRDDVPIELESTDDLDDLANEISKAISFAREKLTAKFHLMEQSGQDDSDHGGSGLNREHTVLIKDVLPKTKPGSECYISRRGKRLKKGIRKVLTAGENAREYHMRRVNAPEKEKALSNIVELGYYDDDEEDKEADRLIKAISLVRERRRAQVAEFHSMEQSCHDISVQGINASNREAVPIEDILPKTKDKSECHISREPTAPSSGRTEIVDGNSNQMEKNGNARKLGKKPKKEYKTKHGKVLRLFTTHNIHPWAQVKCRKLVPRQRRQAQPGVTSAPISGFDTCSAPNLDFDDVDIKWWKHREYEGDEKMITLCG